MAFDENDIDLIKEQFPALARTHNGRAIAYFDGPGGTQVPRPVLDAIHESYIERNANFDGAFSTSEANTAATHEVRETVATFLGAEYGDTISFGANMTSLNYALSRGIGRSLKLGDEVVITALDHEANRGPWLSLAERGIVVKELGMLDSGDLDYEQLEKIITPKTRLVAVGLASNSLGTVNDIRQIVTIAKSVDALVVADAVHYAAHFSVDVQALGVDFLLCSAYKFYGPHIGILYSRPGLLETLDPDRLVTQKQGAPYRIETGTLNYPALAGVAAAIEFIATLGEGDSLREKISHAMAAIHRYEMKLADQYYAGLATIPAIQVRGPGMGAIRTPTISFSCESKTPREIAEDLAQRAIQVWHGHFYAQRILDHYEINEVGGLLRVGMSLYNTSHEVGRLLDALEVGIRRR